MNKVSIRNVNGPVSTKQRAIALLQHLYVKHMWFGVPLRTKAK